MYRPSSPDLDNVEREFEYLIWKAVSLGQPARVKELQKGLDEYRILYRDGGKK